MDVASVPGSKNELPCNIEAVVVGIRGAGPHVYQFSTRLSCVGISDDTHSDFGIANQQLIGWLDHSQLGRIDVPPGR